MKAFPTVTPPTFEDSEILEFILRPREPAGRRTLETSDFHAAHKHLSNFAITSFETSPSTNAPAPGIQPLFVGFEANQVWPGRINGVRVHQVRRQHEINWTNPDDPVLSHLAWAALSDNSLGFDMFGYVVYPEAGPQKAYFAFIRSLECMTMSWNQQVTIKGVQMIRTSAPKFRYL